MKRMLNNYIGRIVSLNEDVFQEINIRAMREGHKLENRFLVSEINRTLQKVTCNNANFRIVANVTDVELVETTVSAYYPRSVVPSSHSTST